MIKNVIHNIYRYIFPSEDNHVKALIIHETFRFLGFEVEVRAIPIELREEHHRICCLIDVSHNFELAKECIDKLEKKFGDVQEVCDLKAILRWRIFQKEKGI